MSFLSSDLFMNPVPVISTEDSAHTVFFPYVTPREALEVSELFNRLGLSPNTNTYRDVNQFSQGFSKVGVLKYDGIDFSFGCSSSTFPTGKKDI